MPQRIGFLREVRSREWLFVGAVRARRATPAWVSDCGRHLECISCNAVSAFCRIRLSRILLMLQAAGV